MRRRYKIINVGFLGGTKKEIVEFILESNKDSGACIITSAGPRQCVIAATTPQFKEILNEFDIVTMNGVIAKSIQDGKYFGLEPCSGWDILKGVMNNTKGDSSCGHYFVGTDETVLQSLVDKYSEAGNSVLGYEIAEDSRSNALLRLVGPKGIPKDSSEPIQKNIKYIWILGRSPWIESICLNSRSHFPGVKLIAINSRHVKERE